MAYFFTPISIWNIIIIYIFIFFSWQEVHVVAFKKGGYLKILLKIYMLPVPHTHTHAILVIKIILLASTVA